MWCSYRKCYFESGSQQLPNSIPHHFISFVFMQDSILIIIIIMLLLLLLLLLLLIIIIYHIRYVLSVNRHITCSWKLDTITPGQNTCKHYLILFFFFYHENSLPQDLERGENWMIHPNCSERVSLPRYSQCSVSFSFSLSHTRTLWDCECQMSMSECVMLFYSCALSVTHSLSSCTSITMCFILYTVHSVLTLY